MQFASSSSSCSSHYSPTLSLTLSLSVSFVLVLQISSPISGNYLNPISFFFFFSFLLFFSAPFGWLFYFDFEFRRFRFSFAFVSIMLGFFDSMILLLVWIAIDMNCCLCWLGFDLWLSESITSHSDFWVRWWDTIGCQSQLFLWPLKLYSVCTWLQI